MTDLVARTDSTDVDRRVGFLPNPNESQRIWDLAKAIATTDFVPKALRGNAPAILAAMLTGRELGILPMRALRQVSIIEGKPAPSPELMMAMALKAGHYVRVVETSRERCVVRVRRTDWPEDEPASELEWTLEDAAAAGLCRIDVDTGRPIARSQGGKPLPWEAYTRAMLRSRAVSEACRTWLPDVVEGASYAPEELGAVVDPNAHDRELADGGFDPLEGESDEVRTAVAEAMGDEAVVDANGREIVEDDVVDAEVIDDDDEDDEDPPPPDAEPDPPVRPDAPTAPERAPEDDGPFPDPEADAATASTDLNAEAATDARRGAPRGGPVGADLEELEDDEEARAEVDLADVPDPSEDETGYATWLAAVTEVYRDLNVAAVTKLTRDRWVDLDDGRRLAIPGGRGGLDLIARLEEHTPGPFRRTVKGALETAGWRPPSTIPSSDARSDHDAPSSPSDPGPGTAPPDAPSDAPGGSGSAEPEPLPEGDDIDARRELLRRWKAAHRELSQVDEEAANRHLSARMSLGLGDDQTWRTFPHLDTMRDIVKRVEVARSQAVPF